MKVAALPSVHQHHSGQTSGPASAAQLFPGALGEVPVNTSVYVCQKKRNGITLEMPFLQWEWNVVSMEEAITT